MKSNLFLLLAALLCAATVAQAQTEKRLALVIGNAAYTHATILDNAVNDAYSMRDALQSVGFEVICKTNLNYTQMDDEINAFVRKLANYDAGLVFFAGHGCNPDDGSDYLLPIEARGDWLLPQIRKNAISVQYVEDMMGAVSKNAKKSNILILDACRNNMLVRSLNRDVIDSWQPPKSASSAQGTLVAYGAAKGQKASDGRGNNGLFTSKLIKHLKTPNLAITEVFRRVRGEVFDECKEQIPEVRDRLFENFYFVKTNTDPAPVPPVPIATDSDGDGVPDAGDECPKTYGEKRFSGCPDSDSDGIPNNNDKCPYEAGTPSNNGCPVAAKPEPVVIKPAPATTSDLPNNMIYVASGTFKMGSDDGESDEKPVHDVYVNSFYISKYETTVAEFKQFIDATGYQTDADKNGGSYIWTGTEWKLTSGVSWKCGVSGSLRPESEYNHPVIHVSHNDAVAFCEWKTKTSPFGGKGVYRLPTEAEWEYAAKGGNQSRNYKYSGSNTETNVGWLSTNSGSNTHAVGQKTANELGLYDFSGNVWEWCADWYDSGYYANSTKTDPQNTTKGSTRVLRGGSWRYGATNCRSAYRSNLTPVNRSSYIGFRLASQ